MATSSELDVLSALTGILSSYLALMRGKAQQRREKHHIFCFGKFPH